MRHNVKVPIVHLWSKFGYNWSEPVRTGAIWKRLTETLTDGRTDARTDIQNLDRYVSPRTFVQATQKTKSDIQNLDRYVSPRTFVQATQKTKFYWKITSKIVTIFVVQSLLGSLFLALRPWCAAICAAKSCARVQWQWKTLIKSRLLFNRGHTMVIPLT